MSYALFSVPYKRHVVFSLSIMQMYGFFCCHLQDVLLPYHMQCAVFPMHFSCYIQRMFFSSHHIHGMFFVLNVLCMLFLTICNTYLHYNMYVPHTIHAVFLLIGGMLWSIHTVPPSPFIEGMLLSYNMQAKVFSFRYDIVCFIHMLFFCQINLLAIQITCGHKASPMLMLVIFNFNVVINICSCDDTVDRSHND